MSASEPWSVEMIARFLRNLPAAALPGVRPQDFHRWPARKIVPAKTIRELIANEQARRQSHG